MTAAEQHAILNALAPIELRIQRPVMRGGSRVSEGGRPGASSTAALDAAEQGAE